MDDDELTVWCGNLPSQIDEELLYELFLQIAPLKKVRIPTDKTGKYMNYGFVSFKHKASVQYAIEMFNNLKLYDRNIIVRSRAANKVDNKNVQPLHVPNPLLMGMCMGNLGFYPIIPLPQQLIQQQHEFHGKERSRHAQHHNDTPYRHQHSYGHQHRSSSRSHYEDRSRRYRH